MRALPVELEEDSLLASLAEGWGFAAEAVEYAPVGLGGYHWLVADAAGRRGFVTVHDLEHSPWLGDTREAAFDRLRRAFAGAAGLRDGGLRFVVAPIAALGGESVRRLGPRYTIALFPLIEGASGVYGEYLEGDRASVIPLLAELHHATSRVASLAPRERVDLPGRRHLEAALADCDTSWAGGPLSEPARRVLVSHASDVARLLEVFDRLARTVATSSTDWVVTHGEPHGGNLIRTGKGLVLVDWDTVALAPPERDLMFVVAPSGGEAGLYTELTGRPVDASAIELYRIRWDLIDVAFFLSDLRAPHEENADTLAAYENLRACANVRDRWASLLV